MSVRGWLWIVVPVALAAYAAVDRYWPTGPNVGPPIGDVPAFELVDQLGRSVNTQDLRGKVWVADFVFTRCAAVCPILSARMQSLQRKVGDQPGVHFVSFSVDPEHDTPEVLKAYAGRYEADPERWWFLTGPLDVLEQTVVKGFKIYIGETEPSDSDPTLVEIAHGEHFVLVDQQARIRGYYRSDREGLAQMERHLRALL